MIALSLLVALAAEATPTAPANTSADIVVTARRRTCDISIADRLISTREFNARAKDWAAGVPVRVHVPSRADLPCLTKIAFKLGRAGVTRMVFVEPGQ